MFNHLIKISIYTVLCIVDELMLTVSDIYESRITVALTLIENIHLLINTLDSCLNSPNCRLLSFVFDVGGQSELEYLSRKQDESKPLCMIKGKIWQTQVTIITLALM